MSRGVVVAHLTAVAAELYCPSADDLTVAYCDEGPEHDKPCPQLTNQGWKIEGGGGAATKSAFNLNGGFVEFDLDVSNVDGGVNANLYTISPETFQLDHFNKTLDYCDGAATGSDWCMEMDWIESNGHCAAATTVHTKEGPGDDGCTAWGCRTTYHFNGKSKFHMKIEYDQSGQWTVSKDGEVFTDYSPVPDEPTWDYVKSTHESRGAVIYGSEWVGWVPVDDCGTTPGNLYSSSYSISNLVISGTVVQGPVPTECAHPSPAPTPTPSPSPSDCPGGSYDVCVSQCPSDDELVHKACVGSCARRCPDAPVPTPTPSPAPTPAPTDCPGGSYNACVKQCPTDDELVHRACVGSCARRCPDAPVPTPPPMPVPVPTPTPTDCPGGSYAACVSQCPTDDELVHKACVGSCARRCPDAPVPTPTPSPAPTPAPTDCPGGSYNACVSQCPTDDELVHKACVGSCARRCPDAPTPTPVPVPVPTPVPTPTPSPAAGKCKWGWPLTCDGAQDTHVDAFCDASQEHCESNCGGVWCTSLMVV